jgi:hypothetical protein
MKNGNIRISEDKGSPEIYLTKKLKGKGIEGKVYDVVESVTIINDGGHEAAN